MKKLIKAVYDFMLKPRHPYKAIRIWRWKRRVNRSIRVLDELDWVFKSAGWSRTKRRQFWRDFVKKHKNRTAVLNRITQQ